MKIAVAMSGGVDSSMAAALLKEEGHDIFGITMQAMPGDTRAVQTARNVAAYLGIPHHTIQIPDIFAREIITYFCEEYQRGRTPNHCVRCNRFIKFGVLRQKAQELGADFFATGHHARVTLDRTSGRYQILKGVDPNKDQSYFLYLLTQEQLSRTLFPIGNFHKSRLKEIAHERGMPVAARESQEVCFAPGRSYTEFLKEYLPPTVPPGRITDENGKVLGKHRGIPYYTIGQRKGLGLSAPEPLYVTAIDAENNVLVVGTREKAYGNELVAGGVNWVGILETTQTMKVTAKIRYRQPDADAEVTPREDGKIYVRFSAPQMAITPGQAVVCYDNDSVICGGTIEKKT